MRSSLGEGSTFSFILPEATTADEEDGVDVPGYEYEGFTGSVAFATNSADHIKAINADSDHEEGNGKEVATADGDIEQTESSKQPTAT